MSEGGRPAMALPQRVRGRKTVPWRQDPVILERLPLVERLHLAGRSNRSIAAEAGVDESTVRLDLKRLRELWLEQTRDSVEVLRAQAVAALMEVKRRAIEAAEFDEMCERAVLFGQAPDGVDLVVQRDEKGSAQFRGNKAAALTVARQAVMDAAKLLGLVVEKQEHSGEMLVREYVGVEVKEV